MSNDEENTKEGYDKEKLDKYVKDYRIFIDTCSLLESESRKFWSNIIPVLYNYRKNIIVPKRIIDEIEKHSNNKQDIDLSKRAQNCKLVLNQLINSNFVEIRGEETDNFADNVFQVVFTKFRMTHNLLLITQDKNLAEDILRLNDSKSVKGKSIIVKKIDKEGNLRSFNFQKNRTKTRENKLPPDKKFKLCKEVTSIPDTKLNISIIPSENETVYTSKYEIKLVEELGAGGEAIVYKTNTPYVAKIYKKDNLTTRKYEKIKLMLTKKINCPGICYPIEIIYNSKEEFIGYLMPSAEGIELQRSVFAPKPLFLKKFPGWKKRDTVQLCITILKKIIYLHKRNIIIGDINPANILVVSPEEVYFVDTDSYQVEEFPCPVGTNNFTAPEIQRKHFPDFLRTMGNENFAVATLMFMIMLPGKPPYSQQGGEDPVSNIIKMDFSYPFGESSNKKTPEGPWRYIWSHLTYELKEAFYHTFRKEGKYSVEEKRLTAEKWLHKFKKFLKLLDNGEYRQQDEMSEELFPIRLKKNPNATYIRCKICNQEVDKSYSKNGICKQCLNKGEIYYCERCGKELLYTNYQKYVKNSKRYNLCQECFDYSHAIRIRQNCIDCGEIFELTNNEYDFYKKKGYDIPKRCKSCREAKKSNSNNTSTSNTGRACFITTAVCEYYGKDDDCEELTILREYRDYWLINQDDGEAIIREYYNCAPKIVSLLKQSERYGEYCEELMKKYISPCIEFIKCKKYLECKNLYTDMVIYAKSITNINR